MACIMTSTLRPLAALALLLLVASCTRPPVEEPATGLDEAPAEAPQEADPASWEGEPMPDVDPSRTACHADDACRVWRPSSWNARVECCYEYGCAMDWTPIHADDWERLRAWRQANPFDCQEAIDDDGPCAVAPDVCGLQLDATAACVEERCTLVLPTSGPTFTDSARTCRTDSHCVAVRRDFLSERARCCEGICGTWTAISTEALSNAEAWLGQDAPACPTDGACPEPSARCDQEAPQVRCLAGLCRLEH